MKEGEHLMLFLSNLWQAGWLVRILSKGIWWLHINYLIVLNLFVIDGYIKTDTVLVNMRDKFIAVYACYVQGL